MSGFQAPITIHQAIDRINRNEFLLPSFQREFVWSHEQIQKLFDSLMKGYPISSMLFWKVKGETKTDFRFYQFLKQFIQYHKTHNEPIDSNALNDFHAILDGQQRLTALYLGLGGSYAYKEYRKSYSYSESSYPTRHLYLNLSSKFSEEESDMEYKFYFWNKAKSNEQVLFKDDAGDTWFKIGYVLKLRKDDALDDFMDENGLTKDEKKIIRRLDRVIHNELLINYYEEDEQIPDKAVNIFVRINSGGTFLSFSDILMSIAVASWKQKDARTEIYGLVDQVRAKGFSIDKDFVLKAFLFLYHKDVRFRITSFRTDFIANIEDNWDKIRDSILSLFDLIKTFGLNDYTLTTNNALLPILYYIFHRSIYIDFSTLKGYEADREIIRKWLYTILVRRTFGGNTDTVLAQARKAFTDNIELSEISASVTQFPAKDINTQIKKLTDVGDDFIEELLLTQKGSQYSFPILALLYPDLDYKNNNFHQDHLHPETSYKDLPDDLKKKVEWETYNSILNLQMLDANENMSKQHKPLKDWVDDQTASADKLRFLNAHIIPTNNDLELKSIEDFLAKRKTLLIAKLKTLLN